MLQSTIFLSVIPGAIILRLMSFRCHPLEWSIPTLVRLYQGVLYRPVLLLHKRDITRPVIDQEPSDLTSPLNRDLLLLSCV